MDDLIAFLNARLDEDEAEAKAAANALNRHIECDPDNAAHIARHDPARVLREVAAKRAIVERYAKAPDWAGGEDVRLLAAVWSDHPDYRQEWRT